MAISILIADPSEADQFIAHGLDLALRLDKPLAILCIAKSDEKDPTPQGSSSASETTRFSGRVEYTENVKQSLRSLKAGSQYESVATQVFEVPPDVEEIRTWLADPPHTETLGRFDIDTLFIPIRRDEGDKERMAAKNKLFGMAHCETVLSAVNQSLTAPLPLDAFACIGATPRDIRKSRRFASRFRPAKPTVKSWQQDDPAIDCVVLTVRGKAGQTRIDNKVWNAMRRDASLPIAMGVNPADSLRERYLLRTEGFVQSVFADYQMARKDRERLASELTGGTKASPEFLLFMSVATVLASIGLLQDSPAVIIGAMLVAPLMTPLLGAGLAMIQGNRPLFFTASRAILIGVCLSFTIGAFMGLVSAVLPAELFAGSGLRLTNAMISRSHPNLLDPLIGFAAGLAGGFAVGRDKKIGALAGVAIAAALVPPIATAGIETTLVGAYAVSDHGMQGFLQLVTGDPADLLSKAKLIDADHNATHSVRLVLAPLALFLMNACTVILGAFLGLRLVGMHRTMYPKESQRWVSVAALGLILALLCLLMLIPVVALYA